MLVSRHEATRDYIFTLRQVICSWGSGIPIAYVQVRQNGMPKIKEMRDKVELECFVKACFIFIEIVKY